MRPLEIWVEGFTCYRQGWDKPVSLRDLDLFAITGPTGSGKSSLIDAMVFALYGRIPRLPGNQVQDVIAQGRDRASVQLVFSSAGREYRALRQVRSNAPSVAHLEELDPGTQTWVALVDGVNPVTQRIEALVGLDFDTFVRTVLLPQGQFQRFLAGDPRERHGILKELLQLEIYEQVMQLARRRASGATDRANGLERDLQTTYAEATPERLEALKAEHAGLLQKRAGLEARVQALAQATEQARELEGAQQQIAELKRAIAELGTKLEDLVTQVKQARQRLLDGEASLSALEKERGSVAFDPERLQRWGAALAYVEQAEKLAGELDADEAAIKQGKTKLDAVGQAVETARQEAERAEAARQAAEERHHLAQTRDMARALRHGLSVGDPCPVCGRPIQELPEVPSDGLARAEAERNAAEKAREQAEGMLTQAKVVLGKAQVSLDEAIQRRERRQGDHEGIRQTAAQHLGDEPVPTSAQMKAYLGEQRQAQQQLLELENRERGLRDQLERDKVLLSEAGAKEGSIRERIEEQQARHREAEGTAEGARARIVELATAGAWPVDARSLGGTALRQWCESTQLQGRAELSQVEQAVGQTEERMRRLEADIARAEEMRREMAELRERAQLASTLATLLRADRLQAFVERRALQVLAEDGSAHLDTLSQGRYALQADERGFQVIDHWNADEPRSVHTLSGGETFLASLALALGLAQRLPQMSTNADAATLLESLFIDEGFGALDAETLDVAASALEQLFVGRSMVGVITHVEALAARLPVQLEVLKSPSGSSVRRRDGAGAWPVTGGGP